MAIEFLNPKNIEEEFILQDGAGNRNSFKLKALTRDVLNALKLTEGKPDIVYEQMSIFLGGKKENFFNYDITVLNKFLDYVTDIVKNPTKET